MKSQWKKIALHTHTFWSDGKGTPEQMISAFRSKEFDAAAWTDHNYFPDGSDELYLPVMPDAGRWPGSFSSELYNDYKSKFKCYEKHIAFRTLVRIRNYPELKKEMEEPGRFLLLPGGEFTSPIDTTATERELHMNYINLGHTFPFIQGRDSEETIALNKAQFDKRRADAKACFIVNHPLWRFYNVDPMALASNPSLRHFEICNGGSEHGILEGVFTPDSFFDIVTSFRLKNGMGPMCAAASDDSHLYLDHELGGIAGVGNAFIMADVSDFSPEGICDAIERSAYYPSTGVFFDEIRMDGNTLKIRVKPEKNVHCKIIFIATGKDFNSDFQYRVIQKDGAHPARKIPFFSDEIGRVVKTVEGNEAECKFDQSYLYLRALAVSDAATTVKRPYFPSFKCAWTQIMTGA